MLDNNIALNTYSSSNSPFSSHKKYRNFFLVVLLVSGLIVLCLPFINLSSNNGENFHRLNLNDLNDPRMVQLRSLAYGTRAKNSKCTYWDCFNVYLCGCTGHERIAVYVYPLKQYFTENGKPVTTKISKEFYDIVKSIVESKYYTSNPHEACLFIPFIDTLNEDILDGNLTSRLLNQLPRNWKVIASQIDIDPYFSAVLQQLSKYQNDALLLLDRCSPHIYTKRCEINSRTIYEYPQVLRESTFCLVFRGKRMSQFILSEAMAANCIPVIVMDGYVMPFHEIIDWNRAAIFIMEANLNTLMDVIDGISDKKIVQMRNSVIFLYRKYFSSMGNIAINTLDIIQDRVFPHRARTYDDLNLLPSEVNYNPLYFPTTAPKATGFTAVILTYDRIQSLFILIERLVKVPSLTKIVVVWNNKKKDPPALSEFPIVSRPISIIKTQANKLSNRFYPYKEIETEAVLHIDDDIVMLTSDEIEFAFEVWREFPDRIVGFPSRTHFWDNITNTWKYESEWLNEISMVLTGAAFLHKYWSYLYTYKLPEYIRAWVDNNMNCEDIAMNFLVANVTNKPPIKVTPRKKFKCPECASNEMLSADIGHMVARSQCVDRFAQIFRRMPLKLIEFRADPVLFKDSFPEKLKRFNNIGSL
ncbi:exostosin-2 isoform X2 [Anthonomus grandis grandis]|uniref:exostosin-2 isoform X2 n=1 Tax=Anthonomus grandis grandis TaxID=2921223 RepID=UPI0021669511|nr:exostosin-2 isoform X2 [Anthonomus grandis grandis]